MIVLTGTIIIKGQQCRTSSRRQTPRVTNITDHFLPLFFINRRSCCRFLLEDSGRPQTITYSFSAEESLVRARWLETAGRLAREVFQTLWTLIDSVSSSLFASRSLRVDLFRMLFVSLVAA